MTCYFLMEPVRQRGLIHRSKEWTLVSCNTIACQVMIILVTDSRHALAGSGTWMAIQGGKLTGKTTEETKRNGDGSFRRAVVVRYIRASEEKQKHSILMVQRWLQIQSFRNWVTHNHWNCYA